MEFPEWPLWLTHLVTILMGLIVGSFTNVIVARLPHGKSVVTPRSACPQCGKPIAWYDNLPVISYLILGGKCRNCKLRIPLRYPMIELLTALLFLAARIRFGWGPLLWIRDWPFITLLVSMTFIDLEHRILPDKLTLGGLVLGLATAWFVPELGIVSAIIGAALGFGIFYALAWSYILITGRSGLGGGDIKLLAMLGAFLGPSGVVATILLSSIMGSVIGLIWAYATQRQNAMRAAIPYGPFLVMGGLYYYLMGDFLWFQFMTPT